MGVIGDGDGSGYGDGYGDGSGDGDGSGYGDGYGDGSGSGYGSGYGYGYGDGSGSGYGSGYGYDFLKALLEMYSRTDITIAFWRSDEEGKPCNGGSGMKRFVGQIECVNGPLCICTPNALHATIDPKKWKGKRWWVVGLHGEVQRDGDKLASLKREIIADLGTCPFD